MSITRRDALKSLLSATVGATGLSKFQEKSASDTLAISVEDPQANYPDATTTENVYRKEFANTYGDSKNHGYAFHCVNCQGNCAWQVWSKDGKITRENQSANYPSISTDIPDYNPRGCNKGAQHSQNMYEEDRLLYPMKRLGKRGEGKWKRISWKEAIDEVAQQLYQTLIEKGPSGNYVHIGSGVLSEARAASIKRLGTLLGAVRPYISSYVGDMFPGVSVVYGEGNVGCTYDFIYKTNVAIFWGCNPNTSRIPDAHFLWEGKYNGSKIIVISPEFNSTAIHADLWVPIKAGYDGYLALSIIHEIIEKKLYKENFLKEYTDLPFLVRMDSQELLRLSDLNTDQFDSFFFNKDPFNKKKSEKEHELFFVWNRNNNKLTLMPGSEGSPVETLRLKDIDWDIDPALEGNWKIQLKNGSYVEVRPVFQLFKENIKKYSPEKMQSLTGVHPSIVSELAQDLSLSKVALITLGFSIGKHFNGLLSQRAISSLTAFCGRLGPNGGLNTENEWNITGLQELSGFDGRYQHRFASGFVSEFILGKNETDNEIYNELYSEEDIKKGTGFSKAQYQEQVKLLLENNLANDLSNKSTNKPYWTSTETFLLFADARFRRNKGRYKDAFLEKAKFIAYGDYRMSDFATFADILLPCKSHYEVWDIRTNPGYHRFANVAIPPVNLKNLGETKSEWEIATLLVEAIQKLAQKKYDETKNKKYIQIPDSTHSKSGFRALDELIKEFTLNGKLRTDKDAVEFALEHVDQFKPNTTESMKKQGGFLVLNDKAAKSSPLYKNKPYNTFESNFYLHQRFETLTGRLTFYVDHKLWIEMGVQLPTMQEPLKSQKYPLILMTPHARWSIHSTYKTSSLLLRLQRGKPYVMLSSTLAQQKGIQDGDDVQMFNDLGQITLMAKISSGIPDTALVMEHGWESFMYKDKKGHNLLVGDMLHLLELSDGWGHLKFGTNWDGNQHAYVGSVDIKKK